MRRTLWLAVLGLSACATTTITGFSDPDYRGKPYKNFVVVTPNLNLEYSSLLQGKVCNALQTRNISCARGLDLFPPTRTFDTAAIVRVLMEKNIDAYLLLTYGGGSTQSDLIGTMHYGNASVYGNTISAYGSSIPIRSFSRSDGYSVVLIDTQTHNKAWVGGTKTQAQGFANITDDVFTNSLGEQLAAELRRAGHI